MTDTFTGACREADRKKAAAQAAKKVVSAGNGQNTKPVLLIEPGELPAVAERLRDLLAASGMLFDRGVPVRVTSPPDGGFPVAVPLTNHGVVRMAHQHCRPVKDGENATLPDRVAGLYLDMVGDWNLPKLVGITSSPILADDGSIRSAVGYDRDAGLYCCHLPELILLDKPTEEQAQKALMVLRSTFRTFPFADAVRKFDPILGVDVVDPESPIGIDESGFLAGLLTAVCRQSLWLAPGFLLNAPQISGAGSGKGLLARAISAIAYGIRPRPFTPGNDRHEMDKRIVAEVMEGAPVLFMDNINGTLLRLNDLHDDVKAILDPQGRGRQFLARAVQDLTNTRQSGFVLTREKGAGRKSVATYQLKEAPKGGNGGKHTPHTPHTPAGAGTSAESMPAAGEGNEDASGMPPGMPEAPAKHTRDMPEGSSAEIATKTMVSRKAEGMRGMRGMPSAPAAAAAAHEVWPPTVDDGRDEEVF
jgi:hypothetical protein